MQKPSQLLETFFPFDITKGQAQFLKTLDIFLERQVEKNTLIVSGYAGTGKTTLLSTLVKILPMLDTQFVLLAPTGRAAKVLSNYSGKSAYTIHKRLFKLGIDAISGKPSFSRQKNRSIDTIFIVDEVSMLQAKSSFGRSSLLQELLSYVFEEPSNLLIFIGDQAQLPPIGEERSPALDESYLSQEFDLNTLKVTLKEVTRQEKDSGILFNATHLRDLIDQSNLEIKFKTAGYPDIFRMTHERLEDGVRYAYDNFGIEESIIICKSNWQAVQYNQYIRHQIFYYEDEICAGDYLMIVKNNYLFTRDDQRLDFLANGELVEVLRTVTIEERYGFRFSDLELRLVDSEEEIILECKVLLDTLHHKHASIPEEEYQKLYDAVAEDYQDAGSKTAFMKSMKTDPFLNALQIKYAYALTCHKAQGGQWKVVFVDQGYLKEDTVDRNYLRWLYTAITRAKKQLYLLNFNSRFF